MDYTLTAGTGYFFLTGSDAGLQVTSQYITTSATADTKRRFRLLEIGLPTPVRLTECDYDIVWSSYRWRAGGVAFSEIRDTSDGQSASFSIPDADMSLFNQLLVTNGGESATVRIYVAEFAAGFATVVPNDVAQIFEGRVDSALKNTADARDEIQFQCGPPATVSAVQIPVRLVAGLARPRP